MLEAISLKCGMWGAEVGGNVHSKNSLVSSRQHRATEVRKLHFLSSCQYTHGCYTPASWAARHTTVCLDNKKKNMMPEQNCIIISVPEKVSLSLFTSGPIPLPILLLCLLLWLGNLLLRLLLWLGSYLRWYLGVCSIWILAKKHRRSLL